MNIFDISTTLVIIVTIGVFVVIPYLEYKDRKRERILKEKGYLPIEMEKRR